jgi:cephalosporin hydroxylase
MNTYGIDGHVYSVDINPVTWIQHPRVTYMSGNSRQLELTFHHSQLQSLPRPWLVIDDADHSYDGTTAIMNFFHPYLDKGDYLLVEDGLSVAEVVRAIRDFYLKHQSEYEIDSNYCDFYGYNMTCLVNGFLRKLTLSDCSEALTL